MEILCSIFTLTALYSLSSLNYCQEDVHTLKFVGVSITFIEAQLLCFRITHSFECAVLLLGDKSIIATVVKMH